MEKKEDNLAPKETNFITIAAPDRGPTIYKCSKCDEELTYYPLTALSYFDCIVLDLARAGQCFKCGLKAASPFTMNVVDDGL